MGYAFRDKVAVVTGASSGIGAATAVALARRGCSVVGVARRAERLREVTLECQKHAPESSDLAGDLGQRSFAQQVIADTLTRYGRLDILINNAAVPLHKRIYNISLEEAEATLDTNFKSCLWTCFAAIPQMLKQQAGHIVNVSSFAAIVVPPRESVYAASKAAMSAFSEGLWADLDGSGVHVTLVHPGPIETEIWGKLEEPAAYKGRRYPAELVADGILDAIENRRHEVVIPKRSPQLVAARWLRSLCPPLVRRGVRRLDPVPPAELDAARGRAREGKPLGSR